MSTICARCSRRQRVEYDDVVDAVQKLRAGTCCAALPAGACAYLRCAASLAVHREADGVLLHHAGAHVRSHHDHRVLEADRAALAVGQAAVVQNLQQRVEDVRVRLFDFVEQHHRIRPAAHLLGELAAFFVARRIREASRSCATPSASPCTRTYRRGSWPCRRRTGTAASARTSSVLPTPVGPRKMKLPMGRLGSLKPARLRRMALETRRTASSWPTTRSFRRSGICTSFWISPSIMRATGMPVHLATMRAISSSPISSLSRAFSLTASSSCSAAWMSFSICERRP